MKIKKKIIATITLLVVIFNFISSINLESTKADEGNKEKTTISGILICGNCRDDGYIITHSRGCCLMASCGISGYGILVPQEDKTYKFYKFDEEGSDEAYELLKSFSDLGVSNYLSVNVTGYVNDTAGEYKYADGANTKTVKYEGSISELDIEYDETHETYTKNAVTFNDTNVTIAKIPDHIYTGKSIKPKLTIKDGNYTLKATEDYNVSYKSNKDIGTATIVITGVGAFYKGTLTTTFNIVKETEKTDDTPKDNKSEVINSEYNNPKGYTEESTIWSYITFGSYPQSEVKGSNLTSDIINAAYDENGDAVIGNNKYNRVNVPEKIEDGNITEAIKNYNYDIDGYYKDNNVIKYRKIVETKGTKTYNTYYRYEYKYFKYEPITWKVLSNDGTNLKLLADKGLTTRQFYDKEGVEVKWATSTLRTWLNNDFYNKAFTETEKSVINNTTVETKGSEVNSEISGGDATQDKVYLLSVEDVRNSSYGFNSDPDINSPSRILSYTAYSKAVAANNWTGFDVPEEWWLRSPGYWITNPVTVLSNGIVRASGRYDIYTVGVVPVIDVSIASLNKISNKTDDNKPSVSYQTHVQKIGWQNEVSDGALAGTTGKNLRLEAIQVTLTGELAKHYDVYYRVHAQNIGWMGWAKNGLSAGTSGYGYRLEAIQIKLVSKDGKAPGLVENAYKPK